MRGGLVAAVATVALLAGVPAQADGKGPASGANKREEAGLREAKGTVKDVDKGKNQVTLRSREDQPVVLQIDRSTTIFVDGRVGRLDEVKPGAEVRAAYETKRGSNRAQWVEVSEKPSDPAQSKARLPEAPAPAPPPGGTEVPR